MSQEDYFTKNLDLGSSIALVGSSPRLAERKEGHLIDQFDTVIRFNFASTEGFEESVGSRTDLRVVGMTISDHHVEKFRSLRDSEEALILSKTKNSKLLNEVYSTNELTYFKDYPTHTRTTFRRLEPWIGTVTTKKRPPRTGLFLISLLLDVKGDGELHTFGFDRQAPEDGPWQNHYFSNKTRTNFKEKMKQYHVDIDIEMEAINRLADDHIIVFH